MNIERYLKFHILIIFLKKFSDFIGRNPEQMYLLHYATTIRRYFYFAEIQVRLFSEAVEKEFKIGNKIDYTEECDSYCFAFYTLIRTCLEATGKVSDFMQKFDNSGELKKYREENKMRIKNIVQTANRFVKHPLANPSKNQFEFYQPGGLDISGNVSMYEWSAKNDNHFEVPEINPVDDCDSVFKYLEGLVNIYTKIIDNHKDTKE